VVEAPALAARAQIHVVHLTSAHSRNDVRIYLKECRTLAAEGFKVTLIVADGQGGSFAEGVRIVDVGPRSGGRFSRAVITAARVFAAARRLHADICHFHDPELLPWGLLLRISGSHVVYDAHENLAHDILAKHYLPAALLRPASFVVGRCELLAARALNAIVAATPDILERFRRLPVLSAGVYNFPLETELLQSHAWSERKRQACYIGGISVTRGVRELALAATRCATRVVLAGPLWDGLSPGQAAALPGWSQIEYRGVIPRAAVAELMGQSRVGVVTFLGTPSHRNSLPNKLFEYMSAGIPVVASDFPQWREIVAATGSGLCVDPGSPAAIAAAIDRLAEDVGFGAECGRNGARAVAGEFNWSTQARKLLQLYQQLQRQRKRT
jgi:glycosyltransferase involved in cell wall biosynthesis